MASLTGKIAQETQRIPEGVPLLPDALLHLGGRPAADQAIARLAQCGRDVGIRPAMYGRPVTARFGVRPPTIPQVVEAIGALKGETVVPHGAAAANALGVTTQVPVRTVYLTSGRSRQLAVGTQTVELRHAPPWQLALPN